jgi:HlyD family secretion protein
MDRAISIGQRRRRTLQRIALAVPALAAVCGLWFWLPGVLRPSVDRSRIRTALVERGRLEAGLEAAGRVIPAFEKVISSPVEARVVRILRRPGERVGEGDPILELDTAATRLELERLEEQIDQKANERIQSQLALENKLAELNSNIETKRLDVELLQYREQQQRKLHEQGLTAEESLRQAEVEARKAAIELTQLERAIESEERAHAATADGIALSIRILSQERDEARHRLELATTRADRAGVLTWLVEEEGTTVGRGDVLARVADLGSFRIEASISDAYASQLEDGQQVRVRVDERMLPGEITSVRPAIEDGVVFFDVDLERPSDEALRQNLRVDVHVVTETVDDALRVDKGPFARGGALQDVFVIRGELAYRTRARIGLSGKEHYQIVEGLEEGDEVIISDMGDHRGRAKVAVN